MSLLCNRKGAKYREFNNNPFYFTWDSTILRWLEIFLLIGSPRWHKYKPRWGQLLFIRPCLLLLIPHGDSVRDSLLMVWPRFAWTWIPKAKPFLSVLCVAHSPPALQTLQWLGRKSWLAGEWWDEAGVQIKQFIRNRSQQSAQTENIHSQAHGRASVSHKNTQVRTSQHRCYQKGVDVQLCLKVYAKGIFSQISWT